jgi:hypothetical protein
MSAFILCLCYPAYVAALLRADPPSNYSCQLSVRVIVLELFPNGTRP